MATFRGLLQGLFGKRPRYSFHRPKWPDVDLAEVVRDATKKGHDGLVLHGYQPKAAGLRPLLDLPGLKALDLRDASQVTDEHLAELAPLAALEWLDLSGTAINGAGLVKLGPRPGLTHLDLSRTRVVDVTVLALRRFYPALELLDLSGTRVTSGALAPLAELTALRELRLRDLGLEQSAQQAFGGRKELTLVCAAPTP